MIFGKYPQHSEDRPEKIEWNVLKQDSNTLLLISKYGLIPSAYCDIKEMNQYDLSVLEWQHSLARERCIQFYESAFSTEEKAFMVSRETKYGGSNCEDYVFLLTEEEVEEYLPDPLVRRAMPTDISVKNGARLGWTDDTREYTSWWIMPEIISSQGTEHKKIEMIYPKAVFQNGDVQYHSRNVYHRDFTIRPCILIDYDKYLAKAGKTEYPLEYMRYFEKRTMAREPGARSSGFDAAMRKWRLRIQLDEKGLWFLSVFVYANGEFDKYSLDHESADDAHYEFIDEASIRKLLFQPGDEDLSFAEVLIRYVGKNGGNALLSVVYPYRTAQFHFD